MPVYVDNARNKFGRMIMCHMVADTLEELHEMARAIGMRPHWFQDESTPHYDLSQTRRAEAVLRGAIEIDRRQLVSLIQKWREAKQLEQDVAKLGKDRERE